MSAVSIRSISSEMNPGMIPLAGSKTSSCVITLLVSASYSLTFSIRSLRAWLPLVLILVQPSAPVWPVLFVNDPVNLYTAGLPVPSSSTNASLGVCWLFCLNPAKLYLNTPSTVVL